MENTDKTPTLEMEFEPLGYHAGCYGEVRRYEVASTPTKPCSGGRLCMSCGDQNPEVTAEHPFDGLVIEESVDVVAEKR